MGVLALLISFIASVILTPFVIKFAKKIGAVDKPNARKVHSRIMPRLGGLAIYLSFMIGALIFLPDTIQAWPILVGGTIIVIVGIVDDLIELTAKAKLLGQILAAAVTVLGGVQIEFITLPNGDMIQLGLWDIPLTILWIVAITNAINLIDGLDGLAAGVSAIALLSFTALAFSMGNILVALLGLLLIGSIVGFLVFNFYPAKIFMGDTGSLFLGYMISSLAVMGLFKNVAVFSLIIPIIILAVPILDTIFAIIRRIVNKQPISAPDKYHLHHRLLSLGFTHRQAVILIYMMSAFFGIAAVLFTTASLWGSLVLFVGLLIIVELIVEATGLISEKYRPLLSLFEGDKGKS